MAWRKGSEEKLARGRSLIEGFTSPTRCNGSFEAEAELRKGLEALRPTGEELRRLRLRLPHNETGVGTYAARYARVRALLEELEG